MGLLKVDLTVYLYVLLFICFTLASITLTQLGRLNSALNSEWLLSMGVVSLVPQARSALLFYSHQRFS